MNTEKLIEEFEAKFEKNYLYSPSKFWDWLLPHLKSEEVEVSVCPCNDIITVDYKLKQCVKCNKFFDLSDY